MIMLAMQVTGTVKEITVKRNLLGMRVTPYAIQVNGDDGIKYVFFTNTRPDVNSGDHCQIRYYPKKDFPNLPYSGPFWKIDETTGRVLEDYSTMGISDPRATIEKK